MNFDERSMRLKDLGKVTHREIQEGGLNKWKLFNKAMIEEDGNYMLLHGDGK